MGIALAVTLLVWAGAHVWLVMALAGRRRWRRAAFALWIPPLAPWWGWAEGLRVPAMAWGAALVLYAVGAGLTGR